MKTQVIKLDSHDDVNSVRDRISWAKTERILLVFPPRSRNLARILDMRLLQRHAARLGAQIAIVALSEEARTNAKVLNIPIFNSIIAARHQVWENYKTPNKLINRFIRPDLRTMRREAFPPDPPWQSIFGVRFLFFSMGVLAILIVFSLFIPTAAIQLTPATRLQTLTLTISARKDVTAVNLAGSLPARLISMVVEHSKTIQTTGSISIPDQKAQGLVRFRNLTTAQVFIPPGTYISSQSNPTIRFITMTDAVVAAGVGKMVDIPVQAVVPGSIANLPADALVAFEDVDLGTSLAVTNPSPTTGGTDRVASVQTLEDLALVNKNLLTEILSECRSGLAQALAPGDTFFQDTLVVSQVIKQVYFPAEDQSSDTLSLTLRLKCEAQYASQADVNNLAEMSLNANMPEGYIQTASNLAILPAGTPWTDQTGITRWNIKAQRVLHASLDPLIVVQLSLGRRPVEAITRLNESLLLAYLPVIKMTPSWWPWMPIVPFRITVIAGDK